KEVTGYERGTITPFGASTAWPVIADADLTGDPQRRISLGAGPHGVAATVPAEAALTHLRAQAADVTEYPSACRPGTGPRGRPRPGGARSPVGEAHRPAPQPGRHQAVEERSQAAERRAGHD